MKLTPTQCRIYRLLSDGEPHSMSELEALLWDELGENKASSVRFQVSKMREVLVTRRQDITCRGTNGASMFRLVIFAPPQTV